MKKVVKNVLGFICVMSLFLSCAEAATLVSQIIWSLSMMSVCVISAKILIAKFMTKEDFDEKA